MLSLVLRFGKNKKFDVCVQLTGEALTQSSLLEADGENGDNMVTMTTTVEPMNLHHAMLRSPGRRLNKYDRKKKQFIKSGFKKHLTHLTML